MASSWEPNRSRTCCSVPGELVHPMRGSTALGEACSKSSTHDLVLAVPDCIAVLAGLYMRAVVMNGGALRLVSAAWHTGTGPAGKAMGAGGRCRGKEGRGGGGGGGGRGPRGGGGRRERGEEKNAAPQRMKRGAEKQARFLL